jgi:hypothetical protein
MRLIDAAGNRVLTKLAKDCQKGEIAVRSGSSDDGGSVSGKSRLWLRPAWNPNFSPPPEEDVFPS